MANLVDNYTVYHAEERRQRYMAKLVDNYTVYHLHSDYSISDSCTTYTEYIDKAVEYGMKAIAFTEHGKVSGWISKKLYCEEKGIKYIHGVECYLTETLEENIRDNYHTVLLAKNFDGVKEINQLISNSCNPDHVYYGKNRITFNDFFNISNNVIKISACLASPLNKLPTNHKSYERLVKHYDYLEIQPHNCQEQKDFNVHLAALADKYNKPLIAGTDTHSLNNYKAECRNIRLLAKGITYGSEDEFDLTFKSYQELVEMFKVQNALPESIYLEAINNTNVMANMVESFELDKKNKYPILYGTREKDDEIFLQTIKNKFKDKIENNIIPQNQISNFKKALVEEVRVFKKIGMQGFMLSMSELISWCREQNIPIGFGRGSVGGSRVAYVTDIIDLNPETWNTVFSRFCNEDRDEVGDIDIDVVEKDRPKIFQYITQRFGKQKTARVSSYGKSLPKACISEICRALAKKWSVQNPDKTSDENPYSIKKMEVIKKEFEKNEQECCKKYPDVCRYINGMNGTINSQSIHPAGMVISPITLSDNYGVFDKDGDSCLMVDMEECHELGLVKYDFLIVKNIGIINDVCNFIGKEFPKSHKVNWNDEKVWADMIRSPIGIFQFESEFAFDLLRKFKPKSLFDIALVSACQRPSGKSYRDELIQHKQYKNPSKEIDNLFKDSNGFLVFQEQTISFLQEMCGLSGSEADNVRRAIGRKQEDRLKEALPQILDGYCCRVDKPREIAEQEAQQFLQILKDSSEYQFGYNHSVAYGMISYICAYLRCYYPLEFITAYLNNASNECDINNGVVLAQEYGIKIVSPKFSLSKDIFFFDKKSNLITKGLESIKYMNSEVANGLYEMSKSCDTKYFTDVLLKMKNISIDSRQLNILVNINFFEKYGNVREISKIVQVFELFKKGEAKKIIADKVTSIDNIISPYVNKTNAKGEVLKNFTIIDMVGLLHSVEDYIKSLKLDDLDIKTKIQNSIDYLGYVDIQTGKEADRKKLIITDITLLASSNGKIWGYRMGTKSIGTGKTARVSIRTEVYNKNPFKKNDIIEVKSLNKNNKGYWYIWDYEKVF